jgi:type II secretory ATPase GspE/PulE/Tfp pilus assembly ATPase PilB-like protein
VYEVLAMNNELVSALLRNDMAGFNSAAKAAIGPASLAAEAARAAARGVTTVGEAMRIGLRSIG